MLLFFRCYASSAIQIPFGLGHILVKLCGCQVYNGNPSAVDGCATFFRRDKFSHVKKYEVGLCL